MTTEKIDARYRVFRHIQENLMDMVDDGNITGEELKELNDSMGEITNLVLDCLGFEIESVEGETSMKVAINLTDVS
jgi:hypothetical protein